MYFTLIIIYLNELLNYVLIFKELISCKLSNIKLPNSSKIFTYLNTDLKVKDFKDYIAFI